MLAAVRPDEQSTSTLGCGLGAGGVHRCRYPGFAVDLWSRGQTGCRPLGRSSFQHCRRKIRRYPPSRCHLPFKWRPRRQHHRKQRPCLRPHRKTPRQQLLQRFPITQSCCKRWRADLANLERNIEQLKANQQQIVRDSSKAIEELKANQEEMKRVLARVSEQNPPKTSPPPAQPTPTVRKPERTLQSPHARARPRFPREWIYDEDW